MKRYAHRGCYNNITIKENSMKAFQASLKSEFNGIETDLRLIKDGNIIVYHDNNLLRLHNIDKNIDSLSYKYIRSITHDIILLEDLLQLVKDNDLNIILDIKNYNYLIIETIEFYCNLFRINKKNITLLVWNNKKQNNQFITYLAVDNIYNIDINQIKKNNFDGICMPYKNDYNTLQQIIKIKLANLQVNVYFKRYYLRYIESSLIKKFIDKITY